jgi:hypothetical protein
VKPFSFKTARLVLPSGNGWIEIRGSFDSYDLNAEQRELISMMAGWYRQFYETTFSEPVHPPLVGREQPDVSGQPTEAKEL